jgi:hypothetical protein
MEIDMKEKNLKRQIKEMENAKREQSQAFLKPEEVLSFDQWWVGICRRATLRPSLKEIVWADFNSRGLQKEEPASKYEEGLKLFGL